MRKNICICRIFIQLKAHYMLTSVLSLIFNEV